MTEKVLGLECVDNIATLLLDNLSNEERKLLQQSLTASNSQLITKAFGPEFWSMLSALMDKRFSVNAKPTKTIN